MSTSARQSIALSRRGREATRRRRPSDLKFESLEPRLALATGLLSTLVSVIRDNSRHSLLRPGATAAVREGTELAASVRLTRRPNSDITVTFESLAPLEVGVPSTALRFTQANWNKPQPVSFAAFQDGVRDGDQLVPVRMTAAVAATPRMQAAKRLVIKSLDSRVVTPTTPVADTYRGSVVGGGNSGSVQGTYDSALKRGTVTLNVTMPQLVKFRDRVITVGYSVGPDSRVQIESLEGITASRFRWNVTYRQVGVDRGLFGTFTVRQPILGRSATATMTAAAVPSWVGTKQLGAANQLTFGNAVGTDSSGNVYVAGSTRGGLDGNALTGTSDFFLTKYTSGGVRLYTKQLGVANKETVATAVVTDTKDNVYVAGYTTGGLYGNTMQPDSTHEFFVSKYDSSGVKQFTRQVGVAGEKKVGIAVTIDANDNIFVAGYTTGALDGYAMTGTVDSFISKFNSDGVKQYTRLLGVPGKETRGYGVVADASGNVFVAGYTEGSLDENTVTGPRDFFVAKYDNSGVKQFTRQLGAVDAATVGTAVTVDAVGDVFVVGYTEGSLDGNALTGSRDFFVTKYSPSGLKLFTRQLGAVGAVTAGNEVATDPIGDVFVVGATTGGLDGNARTGLNDLFVTKYDPSGVRLYTRQLGVAGRETYGNGVATDAIGDVFVAGSTNAGLDGNAQAGVYDFFVTKFSPDGDKQ
jgi:hypothetical protein